MIGDGSNALNGFGGGQYQPPDTRDYDPNLDGCPVCGGDLESGIMSDEFYCCDHGWFSENGEALEQ